MEAKIYNTDGKDAGKVKLPESIFGLPWNENLVSQVVWSLQENRRERTVHAKDRSEKRGGGRKPWRQKGTGRARHGSRRSPIWIGGGVTHGPTNELNHKKKINKKVKTKALYTVLSAKNKDNEIIFVDSISFPEFKTKNAKDVLQKLSAVSKDKDLLSKKRNSVFIATPKKDEKTYKSFGNFNNIAIGEVKNVNPLDLLTYKYVIITDPKESIAILSKESAKATDTSPKKSEKNENVKNTPKKTATATK